MIAMSKDTEKFQHSTGKKVIRTLDEKIVNESVQVYSTGDGSETELCKDADSKLNQQFYLSLPDGNQPVVLGSGIIKGVIGEGGMARVYRIWNESMEVYRAVKVYHLISKLEHKKRFETEIKISAKLNHPNIVQIHSTGEWNGFPYIEMELVEGVSLEDLIQKHGKIPVDVVAGIGIQIVEALCYAHQKNILLYGDTYKGIIHRDLKPANIMISDSGVVKLLDFGIARPVQAGLHTISGNIVGTLPYLSPEQIDNKEIDQRSDIYSLGTVLYEALTGEKTFPQETVTALMKMKSTGQYRKFNTFSCNVPLKLERMVEKCLYEDKDKRFNSASELKKTLSIFYKKIPNQPSFIVEKFLADPDTCSYTTDKVKHSNRKPFLIGLCTILSIGIFTIAFLENLSGKESGLSGLQNTGDSLIEPVGAGTDSIPMNQKMKNSVDVDTAFREVLASKKKAYPVRPQRKSRIDKLKVEYRKNDLYEIADSACKASRFEDAIFVLESTPYAQSAKEGDLILLTYAYLEIDSVEKAEKISRMINSLDAFFCVVMGRIALARKNEIQALEIFHLALTRSSRIRSDHYVRSEALYYAAMIYDNWFMINPSPDNRQFAMISWKNLKRIHEPNQERYKLAERKLSRLREAP